MTQIDFNAWGIQTGPFAAHAAHFVLKLFNISHFYTGRPILLTLEGQYGEKGFHPSSKMNETEGFRCLGHSN